MEVETKTTELKGSTFLTLGDTFRHAMKDGFHYLLQRRCAIKTMMAELKWFYKERLT